MSNLDFFLDFWPVSEETSAFFDHPTPLASGLHFLQFLALFQFVKVVVESASFQSRQANDFLRTYGRILLDEGNDGFGFVDCRDSNSQSGEIQEKRSRPIRP